MKIDLAPSSQTRFRKLCSSHRLVWYAPFWTIGLILVGCGGGSPFTLPSMPNVTSDKSLVPRSHAVASNPLPNSVADDDVYLQAARLFDSQGRMDEAARHYELAMQASPENTRILIAYARLLDRIERFDEAERMYMEALRREPNNASIHNDLGLCQARAGRLDDSLQSLDQAVRLSPEEARFRNNIAKVLVEVGRHEDGFQHLETVYSQAIAHHNLAYFLQEKQEIDLATRHFARAIELDPSLPQYDRVRPTTRPTSPSAVAVTQWDTNTRSYAAARWKSPGREPAPAVRLANNFPIQMPSTPMPLESTDPLIAHPMTSEAERRVAERTELAPRGSVPVSYTPGHEGLYSPSIPYHENSPSGIPLKLLPAVDTESSDGGLDHNRSANEGMK